MGYVEPWLMARWKGRIQLPLALTVEALQGKTCQDSLLAGGGRSVLAKISGGRGRPWGTFLVSTKLNTFAHYANCTVLRAVVLTQYRRLTSGRTDGYTEGIAVACTVLAMRALRALYKEKKQDNNIMSASATQGGHNKWSERELFR